MELGRFIEKATPMRALGAIVSKDGREIARHTWEGACRRNVYSASKSVTSIAVGIAEKEGLLSLDERLIDAFSHDLPNSVSENLEKARVRDLLTMCLGQEKGFLMGVDRPYYEEHDWAKLALAQPFKFAPGERFVYNNVGPYLAGLLVQRRSGCDLVHYLMPRLFQPMGITLPTWEVDPMGNTFGAGGLFLTLDELHMIGCLCLAEGSWNGKQLVPKEWIREATGKQVDNDRDEFGYGYLFWRGAGDSYRADGKYGQFTIVYNEKNAVITVVAESRCAGELLKLIHEELYTQL